MSAGRPKVNLRYARAKVLAIDPPPAIALRGFTYTAVESRQDVRGLLGWLRMDPDHYLPQPYDQLADALRRAGDESGARKVAISKQTHRIPTLGPEFRSS